MSAPAVMVVTLTPEEFDARLERALERALASARTPAEGATVSIRRCGLPAGTRKRATRAGKLPTFRVGRELHVRIADVQAFIESGKVERADVSPELARAMRGAR